MKESFRQSMAWLHTWTGLLVCWLLLLVFAAGTASYYRNEISLWMQPETHSPARTPVSTALAAQTAVTWLQQQAPEASRWFITLPTAREPVTRVSWQIPAPPGAEGGRRRGNFKSETLDPASGQPLASQPRATRGGDFFYRLHFDLHYLPAITARWIVGFCAMFMLIAIITGVITHKRIFKDFFTLRPKKGQRSWLDAHNASAVLALPFHLMITYTGLVTLMFLYMPWGIETAYEGDSSAFYAELFPRSAEGPGASGERQPAGDIQAMVIAAEARWGNSPVERLTVEHPGDASSTLLFSRHPDRDISVNQPTATFHAVTGELLSTTGEAATATQEARGVLYGFHLGRFANPLLRALFFLSGLAGCAMIATGALLWAVKTRQQYAKPLARGGRIGLGLRLVEGLNIGAIAGLVTAFASFFLANRLLPVGMGNRAQMEIHCFFAAWGLAALLAQIHTGRRMWQWQLGAGAALLLAIPVVNIFTTDSHLGQSLLQGKGPLPVVAFDLVMLLLGGLWASAAWWMGRQPRLPASARAPRAAPASSPVPPSSRPPADESADKLQEAV